MSTRKVYKGKITPTLRNEILIRDENKCVLCGDIEDLQLHHLRPLAYGGKTTDCNIITTCRYCHWYLHFNPKSVMNHRDATIKGLENAKLNGKILGRPIGAKDKIKRNRRGNLTYSDIPSVPVMEQT